MGQVSALSRCGPELGTWRDLGAGLRELRRGRTRGGRRGSRAGAAAFPSPEHCTGSAEPPGLRAPGRQISERRGAAPRVSAHRLAEPQPRESLPAPPTPLLSPPLGRAPRCLCSSGPAKERAPSSRCLPREDGQTQRGGPEGAGPPRERAARLRGRFCEGRSGQDAAPRTSARPAGRRQLQPPGSSQMSEGQT